MDDNLLVDNAWATSGFHADHRRARTYHNNVHIVLNAILFLGFEGS